MDTILNTLHTRLKNPLLQIMIFVLLLVCSVPAWGNPLHNAAGKGDTAAVKALLEARADARAKMQVWQQEYNEERPHRSSRT